MSTTPHAINWFEIPVTDFARAKAFYETVLGRPIETMTMGPSTMGFLSMGPDSVGGAIVLEEGATPSRSGTLVYLNGGDDLAPTLARVEGGWLGDRAQDRHRQRLRLLRPLHRHRGQPGGFALDGVRAGEPVPVCFPA